MSSNRPPSGCVLSNPSGLNVRFHANGVLERIDHAGITVNLFPGNAVESGLANLFLRRLDGDGAGLPLFGPGSPSAHLAGERRFMARGHWHGLRYCAMFEIDPDQPLWFWRVRLENSGDETLSLDLIHAQDLGLSGYGAIRLNEYYVSQYLDHAPLRHPRLGWVIATRQNLPIDGRHPWLLTGSLHQGVSFATDAVQFHGLAGREQGLPPPWMSGLPGQRLQHEHAMAAIQDAPFSLAPGEWIERGFFAWLEPHHPDATRPEDVRLADGVPDRVGAFPSPSAFPSPTDGSAPGLFVGAPAWAADPLGDAEVSALWGTERFAEERQDNQLLSFFTGDRTHVVLRAKEREVLRPHGHILRTGDALVPDEASLTSTVWMDGVFHSMVTQGHVSINRFLSATHTYLSLFHSHGQRLFVEVAGAWQRLALPSAFEIRPEACRWLYRRADTLIEVIARAATDRHELTLELRVLEGPPARCLVTHHIALNGDDGALPGGVSQEVREGTLFVRPRPGSELGRRFPMGGFAIEPMNGTRLERIGGDECLFEDGRSRGLPYLCLVLEPALRQGLRLTGQLVPAPGPGVLDADAYWRRATAGLRVAPDAPAAVRRLGLILPWFAHNALIHYLAPRGLEQYSGGGWGTRDVTQGPVEYLLAVGRPEPVRDLLLRVFRQQNPDGDWPQWFMFFERERDIRPGDSHGDIVFWPLLALAQYLLATGDAALLDAAEPFFAAGSEPAPTVSLWTHVQRALDRIQARLIPGQGLISYGHGDWNDSLQPADPGLREQLCSTWTVTLHYQTLLALARALRPLGRSDLADSMETRAATILADFRRVLLVDGVLAGYAWFDESGGIDYLLHPRDHRTGLSYSLLPMIHAVINDMLTPEEAGRHLDLIRRHLHGPDGAHLFDRPMTYAGGTMKMFQRAESSSFFGREIGNMYTHTHLRYAEALWRHGDAEAFLDALSRAVPIDIRNIVGPARRRQSNCYFSSSDAAFRDRYQAQEEYARALSGQVPLEGGWRVYSSGAGIACSLILRCLLGLRLEHDALIVDPVLPRSLDGLRVELDLIDHRFALTYHAGENGHGLRALECNGVPLVFSREENPYRVGGGRTPLQMLRERLVSGLNELTVALN